MASSKMASSETRDIRMILVGMTGTGKSATGNSILGANTKKPRRQSKELYKVSFQSQQKYQSTLKRTAEVLGFQIELVDTQGFFDPSVPLTKTVTEVSKCVKLLFPGPHVILLVVQIGRFTAKVAKAISTIKHVFGKESIKHMIVVFTGYDSLRRERTTIDKYVRDLEGECKNLVEECEDRYIAIDNTLDPTSEENSKQIESLVQKAKTVLENNKGGYYTREMLDEANKLMMQAEVVNARSERKRRESLFRINSLEEEKRLLEKELVEKSYKETPDQTKHVEQRKNMSVGLREAELLNENDQLREKMKLLEEKVDTINSELKRQNTEIQSLREMFKDKDKNGR